MFKKIHAIFFKLNIKVLKRYIKNYDKSGYLLD